MKNNKGFTIIELLVVVAIVAVLSTVIFASIRNARIKNADAAVKQNLQGIPPQSELFYVDNAYSYAGVCDLGVEGATGVQSVGTLVEGAAKAVNIQSFGVNNNPPASLSTVTCNNTDAEWAVEVPMMDKDIGGTGASAMFCVDSTGTVGYRANSMGNTAVCPAS